MEVSTLVEAIKPYCKVCLEEKELFNKFLGSLSCVQGGYDKPDGVIKLDNYITQRSKNKPTNRIFYLDLPPNVFESVTTNIKANCMASDPGWTRLVIEKPFGQRSDTVTKFSGHLSELFKEDEIYWIDHLLGREVLQNFMAIRFGNQIFSPSWNREHVANVTISYKEQLGIVEGGNGVEKCGVITDIMRHLLQILCLIAIEKPASIDAEDIRDEKVKVLKSITPVDQADVVFGQYISDPGVANEETRKGYLDDPMVPRGSATPTYAQAVLYIKNERWDGVPFFLVCGKALDEQKCQVRIQYRDVRGDIYPAGQLSRNELVICVQPDRAISAKMMIKRPGASSGVKEAALQSTNENQTPDSYERLIFDVVHGKRENFVQSNELEHACRIFAPLLQGIENDAVPLETYVYGSNGPASADRLMEKHGHGVSILSLIPLLTPLCIKMNGKRRRVKLSHRRQTSTFSVSAMWQARDSQFTQNP